MDYEAEIINIVKNVSDIRVLAFLYGIIDELTKHAETVLYSKENATG